MGIFISYSSKEYEEAYKLKTVIENNGVSCWMAPQSIPAGSDYSSEIPSAIQNCEAFVLVLSTAAQNSVWVPKELDIALSCNKTVIPFHIDAADLIDSFNFRLSNVQRIEAFNRISDAYQQLICRLKALACIEAAPVCARNTILPTTGPRVFINQRPGTENFLAAKEARPNTNYTKGPIRVGDGKDFWVLAEIHTDCPDKNSFAENVRLKMSIQKIDDTSTVVKSSILCSSASPQEVRSEISFISDDPFELRYLPGSAFMYSEAYGLHGSKGMRLSDDIFTKNGALVGFRKPDGFIPGGLNNAVTATIKVAVIR